MIPNDEMKITPDEAVRRIKQAMAKVQLDIHNVMTIDGAWFLFARRMTKAQTSTTSNGIFQYNAVWHVGDAWDILVEAAKKRGHGDPLYVMYGREYREARGEDPEYFPETSCYCSAVQHPPCSWCESGGAVSDE